MNVKFFRCAECGNLVELIENGGGKLVCCGQPMKELIPGTTDAAVEKHVPAVKREGNTIHVQVGSVAHPMTEAHLIQWIEAVQDGKPLYDSVRYYGGDYMLTKKDRLSGIVDMTGQEIVPPMYDTLGGDYAGLLFEGGYQAALEGGKLRFLTRDGQVSASVDYELKENDWKGLTNNAPMIYAEMNGKISVFTATRGELPTQYEEAARGQAGQELLAVKQDGLWGCIGMDGEVVVPFVMKYAPEISFDGRYVVGSTAEGYQLFTISYGE